MTTGLAPVLSKDSIAVTVARLAASISSDHPQGVVVVGLLSASVPFIADLVRQLSVSCVMDFFALSQYVGTNEQIKIEKDISIDVSGKDVVLAEAIMDTGLSSQFVTGLLRSRGARKVSTCALCDRPARRILPLPLHYIGHEVGESFLVGYGLGYKQRYRNLANIYAINPANLDVEVNAFDVLVYGEPAGRGTTSGE